MSLPKEPPNRRTAAVDVLAIQWAGTLVSMDYPTHWNLLWHLGWAKKNADDENAKDAPGERYAPVVGADIAPMQSLQTVFQKTAPQWLDALQAAGLPSAASDGDTGRMQKLMCCLPGAWVDETTRTPESWAQALEAPRMPATALKRFVDHALLEAAAGRLAAPVDSFIESGGSGSGFVALARAGHYLNTMPDDLLWLAAWSAPRPDEVRDAGQHWVMMALAHPSWAAHRALSPLARITMPTRAVLPADSDASPPDSAGLDGAAAEAIQQTLTQFGLRPRAVTRVFHDAGVQQSRDRSQLSALLQGTHRAGIEVTDHRRLSGLGDWPGDQRGPAAGLLNLALASAHTHHTGGAALALGLTDQRAVVGAAVGPAQPPDTTPEPVMPWARAESLGQTYLPWVASPVTRG
jgi:hypothetical protein